MLMRVPVLVRPMRVTRPIPVRVAECAWRGAREIVDELDGVFAHDILEREEAESCRYVCIFWKVYLI